MSEAIDPGWKVGVVGIIITTPTPILADLIATENKRVDRREQGRRFSLYREYAPLQRTAPSPTTFQLATAAAGSLGWALLSHPEDDGGAARHVRPPQSPSLFSHTLHPKFQIDEPNHARI